MALQMSEEHREVVEPEIFTVLRLLQENNSLLQVIQEYHKSGRIQEAVKYQELLQKNLTFLSNEVDPSLLMDLNNDTPPTGQISNPPSAPSPSRIQQQQMPLSQQNGHLSPYNMNNHGPSPQMRNGPINTPPGQPNIQEYQQQQMQMPPHGYGLPPQMMHQQQNGYYPPPQQMPYMNGHHQMTGPSPGQQSNR